MASARPGHSRAMSSHRRILGGSASAGPNDDLGVAAALHASTARRPGQDAAADAAAMAAFQGKEWVWVPDESKGFVASWIVGRDDAAETRTCLGEDDKTRIVSVDDIARMNPPQFERVEDIANLTHLNEPSVVHNVRQRFQRDQIYTWSGLFLVAVNPYRPIAHMYSPAAVSVYQHRRREDNAPHVFAVAQQAWQSMVTEGESQSILVTGESGAGKTENTKKVIQYLAAVATDPALPQAGSESSLSRLAMSSGPTGGTPALGRLERQILDANPILEAFGNAQTIKNDNSSRFGKFVKIEFAASGAIAGASIEWYLLEKARVTSRNERERNFHVFYQLLRGADPALKSRLLLEGVDVDACAYLSGSATSIAGVDDRREWADLVRALDTVGVTADEQLAIFRVIAAALLLGNLAIEGQSHVYIRDDSTLDRVCQLLGVSSADLKRALAAPRIQVGSGPTKEVVSQARSREQVLDEAGALAKALYERQFGALVGLLNRALDHSLPGETNRFIGVLDIAGFEIFERNSFEQLCINLTNERLQQFFNHHMFVLEQDLYEREGIDWSHVDFALNSKPTIDLIESAQPIGILAALDDACVMPNASDASFTTSLHERFARGASEGAHTASYAPAKYGAMGFVVAHYAGRVAYDTKDWLAKNKDPLNSDLTAVLARSSNRQIATFFAEVVPAPGGRTGGGGGAGGRVKKGVFRTVGQRHREQLASLMAQLQATQPHFVRCIVPNLRKRPGAIDVPLVLDQLRCNGVVEGIRIARLGYPNRLAFQEFRNRYEVLTPGVLPPGYIDGRAACERMTAALELDPVVFRVGRSKVFFKAGVLAELEQRRDGLLYDLFAHIQAGCRRIIAQRRLRKLLNRAAAIETIQRNWRAYKVLKRDRWWRLYIRVKPMLKDRPSRAELQRKERELAEAHARAEREEIERARLVALEQEHRLAYREVADELATAQALARDQALQIARLGQERDEQLRDMDETESQLDRLLEAEQQANDRAEKLRAQLTALTAELAAAAERIVALEQARAEAAGQLVALGSDVAARTAEHTQLVADRDALTLQLADLRAVVQEREEDVRVAQARTQQAIVDADARLETAAQQAQIERDAALRDQAAKSQAERDELKRSVEAFEALAARRESDATSTSDRLAELRREHEAAQRDLGSLRQQLVQAETAVATAKDGSTRDADALAAMRQTADQLRALLDTKASEETRRGEAIRLKDEELTRLRRATTEATESVATLKQQHATALAAVQTELSTVQLAAVTSAKDAADLRSRIEADAARLTRAETVAAEADKARLAAETALQAVQLRLTETGREADQARKSAEAVQRQLAETATASRQAEDAMREATRDRDAVQRQVEQLKSQLVHEGQQRTDLQRTAQALETEAAQLRRRTAEAERQMGGLHAALQTRDAELAQAISLQDKTIVEHVHVLEKAKRYTDAQLKETRAALVESQATTQKLEKTRKRLLGEVDDLQRALAHDRSSGTVYIKQDIRGMPSSSSSSEGDPVARERRLREQAEHALKNTRADLRSAHEKAEAATLRAANLDRQRQKLEHELMASRTSPPLGRPPSRGAGSFDAVSAGNAALLADIKQTEANTARSIRKHASTPPSRSGSIDARQRRQSAEHATREVQRQVESMARLATSSSPPSASVLQREVARLQELLQLEATARDAAETAHLGVLEAVNAHGAGAASALDQRHGALEESRRALQAKARADQATIEDLQAHIGKLEREARTHQLNAREAVQALEHERKSHAKVVGSLQQASSASSNRQPLRTMQQPEHDLRSQYDTLARHHQELQRELDSAELEHKRSTTLARTTATEHASHRADMEDQLREADKRVRALDQRCHQLEAELQTRQPGPVAADERRSLIAELEAARRAHANDIASLEFASNQLQAKYQSSLESASLEASSQRSAAIRAREEASSLRNELDQLQLTYENDTHFLASWLEQRSALEGKLNDTRGAYDRVLESLAAEQSNNVRLHASARDAALALEQAVADRNAMADSNRKLSAQLAQLVDESGRARDGRAVSEALKLDLAQAKAGEASAEARAAREATRARDAEAFASQCQQTAAKERNDALAAARQSAALTDQIKTLQLRLIDYESRPAVPTPPQRSTDARVLELENELARERGRLRDLLRRGKSDDAAGAQLLDQLETEARERARLASELTTANVALQQSRASIADLTRSSNRLELSAREAKANAQQEREHSLKLAADLERLRARMERTTSPVPTARGSSTPSMVAAGHSSPANGAPLRAQPSGSPAAMWIRPR